MPENVLVSAGDGYRLAVDAAAVDALRAENLAQAARNALSAGEPEQAHGALLRR